MKISSAVVTGSVMAALGCALALWVLFNLFVELQPEANGLSPAPAIFLSSALIAVGVSRATGGRWRAWALWSKRGTYLLITLCLIAFGLAYAYNILLRLQEGFRRPMFYVSLLSDVLLLLMWGRVLKWAVGEWRSAGTGDEDL